MAIESGITEELGERFKFDQSVYRAEQPIYTPVIGAETYRFDGEPIDVEEWLAKVPKEKANKQTTLILNLFTNESDCIERCLNVLSVATPGNRHGARLRAGMLAGGFIAGGQVGEAKITDLLMQVSDKISDGDVTSEGERKTLFDAINHGKETPILPEENWRIKLDAHVEEWNKRHASVVIGGKHKVMRWTNATLDGRASYEFFSRKELGLLYDHTKIKVGEKVIGLRVQDVYANELMAWARHPMARTYTGGVVFHPGREVPADCYNTWTGFAVDPLQNEALLERIHYHLKNVLCAGNNELYEYLFFKWTAHTIQNPDKPAGAAIVLRGEKGSGKGTLGHLLRALWGVHGLHIANAKHLVGNFNSHLADTCFLFADEAFYSGDRQHEGVLKALITEPTVMVERKGIDAVAQPNYLKIFMSTNADFAVPASRDERRYCVMDVSSSHIGDRAYFNALHTDCESKEIQAAFLYELLNMDLTGWHSGDIPDSKGLRAQRYFSMDSVQQWVVDALIKGQFITPGAADPPWAIELSSESLFNEYIFYCERAKVGEYRRVTQCSMGAYLGKVFKPVQIGAKRQRGYSFGSLEHAIKCFEDYEKVRLAELVK